MQLTSHPELVGGLQALPPGQGQHHCHCRHHHPIVPSPSPLLLRHHRHVVLIITITPLLRHLLSSPLSSCLGLITGIRGCARARVHHRYIPGYWRQTRTRTHNRSVPALQVQVWSWVPSLVPVPVPAVGIPVGDEQGGRAKVRATQATAQCARWCALYHCFCSSQGRDGMAGASLLSGRVTSCCLMCEDEAGASLSLGQQGRVVGGVTSRRLRCEDEAWALLLLSG